MKVVVMNKSDLTTFKTIEGVDDVKETESGFDIHMKDAVTLPHLLVDGEKYVLEVQFGGKE